MPQLVVNMKYLIIYIFITFFSIEISFSQTIGDFSYQSILNNPKKVEKTFKKLGYSNISDNSETIHKLAYIYQTLAIQKRNNNVTLLKKSLTLYKQLEKDKSYRVNSILGQAICYLYLENKDSAYAAFSKLSIINPLIPEAYYYKSFSTNQPIDLPSKLKLVDELYSVTYVTSDTTKLIYISEALSNFGNLLTNFNIYHSPIHKKLKPFIKENNSYGMRPPYFNPFDTIIYPALYQNIYEAKADLSLLRVNSKKEKRIYTIPFDSIVKCKTINQLLKIPETLTVDSFRVSIVKNTVIHKVTKGRVTSSETSVIYLESKSSILTTEMITNLTNMTILDKVYFENISNAQNGFLSSVIGIIRFHK